ncbi:carbohydrate sulfotransferase 1 isoform X2 [Eurytemora carolleeae]|uniref:carbohydrate sulfotransferase 1 isoform X2 n=1 Tax=Eurytemora carolleeae TaxID=1294199 RepID=UPI000C7844FC|nr:carbohydrate sulfotransferase 1 isoform X2 [Eurytemora carolleeae]|eukprot:XP_023346030.1 carbohydrate sulfotransferase 1-like isoform X2 [Eurytemora affinis]
MRVNPKRYIFYMTLITLTLITLHISINICIGNDFQNVAIIQETEHKGRNKNILILSYARSGSSFTGDLLSALPNTMYYFEPFKILKLDGLQELQVQDYVCGLFNCTTSLQKRLKGNGYYGIRTRNVDCVNAETKVIKSIRLHKDGLEPWIYSSDIKVVHLVRDPRGMIKSMNSRSSDFKQTLKNVSQLCNTIQDDVSLKDGLGSRYIRIRYEDLVENTETNLEQIYKFLELPYSDQVKKAVSKHNNPRVKSGNGFYGTVRESGFRTDSWKMGLHLKEIRIIEEQCSSIMEKLNYTIFNPELNSTDKKV